LENGHPGDDSGISLDRAGHGAHFPAAGVSASRHHENHVLPDPSHFAGLDDEKRAADEAL
jgi:hypothetical protein